MGHEFIPIGFSRGGIGNHVNRRQNSLECTTGKNISRAVENSSYITYSFRCRCVGLRLGGDYIMQRTDVYWFVDFMVELTL